MSGAGAALIGRQMRMRLLHFAIRESRLHVCSNGN
jgi:hypothetical protein